jgi:hypothetical protein
MLACWKRPEPQALVAVCANRVDVLRDAARGFGGAPAGMVLARFSNAMRRTAGFGLVLGLLTLGCGGRTEAGAPDPAVGDSRSGPGSGDDAGSGDESGGCAELYGRCDANADTELGECKLGFSVFGTGKACAWVTDNRCYDTREMACNCACPRDRDSQCVSGFGDGPDGRVLVECS